MNNVENVNKVYLNNILSFAASELNKTVKEKKTERKMKGGAEESVKFYTIRLNLYTQNMRPTIWFMWLKIFMVNWLFILKEIRVNQYLKEINKL